MQVHTCIMAVLFLCFHGLYSSLSGLIVHLYTQMLSLRQSSALPLLHLALKSTAFSFLVHHISGGVLVSHQRAG